MGDTPEALRVVHIAGNGEIFVPEGVQGRLKPIILGGDGAQFGGADEGLSGEYAADEKAKADAIAKRQRAEAAAKKLREQQALAKDRAAKQKAAERSAAQAQNDQARRVSLGGKAGLLSFASQNNASLGELLTTLG